MGGKILIVDDDHDWSDMLQMRLEANSFAVVCAYDGAAGLASVRRERPDAILLDATLPGMDGYTVCERIKKDPSTAAIPVIMLTGKSGDEEKRHAVKCGADAYLVKPCEPSEFLRTLTTLMAER